MPKRWSLGASCSETLSEASVCAMKKENINALACRLIRKTSAGAIKSQSTEKASESLPDVVSLKKWHH